MVVQHASMCHCDSLADLPVEDGQEEALHAKLAGMEAAVHQLLLGVGEDPEREGLVDTPRVSRAVDCWLRVA